MLIIVGNLKQPVKHQPGLVTGILRLANYLHLGAIIVMQGHFGPSILQVTKSFEERSMTQ